MHLEVIFQLLMCGPCGHHTCSVHEWIGNLIQPKFVPRMSSLALLEAKIHLPLYITGKNSVDFFLPMLVCGVVVVDFVLCLVVVVFMMVTIVQF